MWTIKTSCRACSGTDLVEVFRFPQPMPLANDFRKSDEERAGYVPCTVLFCRTCSLAFLREVVNPKILYTNYAYETSKSESMRLHFQALWHSIIEQSNADSVIEIGSNDGDFLAFARDEGATQVAGIDAAENLAKIAIDRGITTILGILDDASAECASRVIPKADVIVARHVFAHADDWKGFMRNLDALANQDTLIVIEVPYVVDMLEKVELDQVYSEHLSFVSLKAISGLLEATPFRMQKVMRFPVHGGSIVIFLRRRDNPIKTDRSVEAFLTGEDITEQHWQDFKDSANTAINLLKFKVIDLLGLQTKSTGKTICGFGASAKSTVWISACGFTHKEIKFICDCTPAKQGRFSPGTDIPIVPESELMKQMPDYCIVFAWNYFLEIRDKHKEYLDAGGHFILPGKRIDIV